MGTEEVVWSKESCRSEKWWFEEEKTQIERRMKEFCDDDNDDDDSGNDDDGGNNGERKFFERKGLKFKYRVGYNDLKSKMEESLKVIYEAFDKFENMSLSFNGGKDSIVMLHLVLRALHERNHSLKEFVKNNKLIIFHFELKNSFQEMDSFIQQTKNELGMELLSFDASKGFKNGLEQLVDKCKVVDSVFIGVRRSDPHGAYQKHFEPTTEGWPQMVRVNPILEWSYHDIWTFLLCFNIPYCSLYDEGYSSLGCVHDTIKNSHLCVKGNDAELNGNNAMKDHSVYLPAYMLENGEYERFSRCKK